MPKKKYFSLFMAFIMMCVLFSSCGKNSTQINSSNNPLIISPLVIENDVTKAKDSELISMLEDKLYKNGMIVLDWVYNGVGLGKDESTVIKSDEAGELNYVLVKNMPNIESLKVNCKVVFSKQLLENTVFPMLFEGNVPLFIEEKGKLYINANTGGAAAFMPDFTRAKVLNKTTAAFEVEVPMTSVDDAGGKPFTYKAVKQNGNWVLDSYYYFN